MKKNILLFIFALATVLVIQACETTNGKNTKNANKKAEAVSSASPLEGKVVNGVRMVKMEAKNSSFTPKKFYVEVGEKVKIIIKSTQGNHAIHFEKLNLKTELPEGEEKILEFSAPDSKAKVNFWNPKNETMKGYMIVKPKP